MKLLKKLAAGCIAATCLCTSVMAIPSEAVAASFNPLDVNHDGQVNSTDALWVTRYLAGIDGYTNYNVMDANQDYVINSEDVRCINDSVLGKGYSASYYSVKDKKTVSFPTVSSSKTYCSKESESSRSYTKYNYSTKKETKYTLNLTKADTVNNEISLTSLVDGTDSRERAYGSENTGIVYLSNYNYSGTGFVVGDGLILTTASCVYDEGFVSCPTIYTYNENGERTGKTLTPVEVHVPQKYISGKMPDYNYALLVVRDKLSECAKFELGTTYATADAFKDVPLRVTGVPVQIGVSSESSLGNENSNKTLWADEGKLIATLDNRLIHNTDVTKGEEGAPVYTVTRLSSGGFVYTTIGIDTGIGSNDAIRISRYLVQFCKQNANISY